MNPAEPLRVELELQSNERLTDQKLPVTRVHLCIDSTCADAIDQLDRDNAEFASVLDCNTLEVRSRLRFRFHPALLSRRRRMKSRAKRQDGSRCHCPTNSL